MLMNHHCTLFKFIERTSLTKAHISELVNMFPFQFEGAPPCMPSLNVCHRQHEDYTVIYFAGFSQ